MYKSSSNLWNEIMTFPIILREEGESVKLKSNNVLPLTQYKMNNAK